MFGSAFALIALGVLLALASFVASIWLVVVAFRKGGVGWGLATLLLPFAGIVFAVKFWPDARKPFLASVIPGMACALCFFMAGGMAAGAVSSEMARQMQEEMAKEQARMDRSVANAPRFEGESEPDTATPEPALRLRAADDGPSSAPFLLNTLPPPRSRGSEFDPATITRDGYAPVALSEASKYVGRVAKIVTRDGRSHRGTLLSARQGTVELEQYVGAGTVAVQYGAREVEKLLIDAE